ncbi:site-2 protease family protein [Sanguibacter suaedae]|uniref:Site-2 protease family protein n=1 Tax=Sanguibacter suaedae TaxID=2795737 RepID=A0A934IAM0_9MICO|nr:site-2 protease family protein [Sanguibacter suaedae]MBI9114952.1 site-2 protease family protein [Sanguibacter suaedae]
MDKRAGWVVGRAAGAPVVLQPSALIMVALLTVLFVPTVRTLAPSLGPQAVLGSFLLVVVLMVSVFLHELAHALVARSRGMRVQELALTVWGGHTSFTDVSATPASSALVAVVGPATNLALAGAAWALYQTQPSAGLLALLLYVTAYANAAVGAFNLLPGLPLDGGQITEAATWALTGSRLRGTVVAAWTGRIIAVLVVALAIAVPTARGQQVNLLLVAWVAFVGAFMWTAATQALTSGRRRARVERLDLAALAAPALAVPADASVADVHAARAHVAPATRAVLVSGTHPVGYVDEDALAAVPDHTADTTPAWAVGVPLPPGATLDAGLCGIALHSAVVGLARRTDTLVVVDAGTVVGLVRATDVARAVRLD